AFKEGFRKSAIPPSGILIGVLVARAGGEHDRPILSGGQFVDDTRDVAIGTCGSAARHEVSRMAGVDEEQYLARYGGHRRFDVGEGYAGGFKPVDVRLHREV